MKQTAFWRGRNGEYIKCLKYSDPYRGRSAPLNSKRCVFYIYSSNIGTEYFKHVIYSPFFPLQNAVCFIILMYLVQVLFTFYIQGVLKLKKNNSSAKRFNKVLYLQFGNWQLRRSHLDRYWGILPSGINGCCYCGDKLYSHWEETTGGTDRSCVLDFQFESTMSGLETSN